MKDPVEVSLSVGGATQYTVYAEFRLGDRVQKRTGYKWPGRIVSIFATLKGEVRFVVECTVPEVQGALHIYSYAQLKLQRMRKK